MPVQRRRALDCRPCRGRQGPSERSAMEKLASMFELEAVKAKALSLGGSALAAVLIVVLGRLAARALAHMLSRVLERSGTDKTLVRFLHNLVYALLMVFIVVASLEKIGVNTTSFIGVVAAAGLAIGFALQGSLSNFASGVMIILLHHFGVGDRIEAAGQSGRVIDIQIFSTVLITDDGTRVIVPNNAITSGAIKVAPEPARTAVPAIPDTRAKDVQAACPASVRRSVLVREPPLPVDEHRLEIVVGIGALVSRRAIANLQVHDVLRGLVDDLMGVPVASPESRAHPRRQSRPAIVGAQRGMALQHVQELILPGMGMPQRRDGAWREARQIDAEAPQPE